MTPERAERRALAMVGDGTRLLDDGRDEEAEAAFRGALKLNPRSGAAHNNLGRILFERGALYDAARHFSAAAELMPTNPWPVYNTGLVMTVAGKLDEAIEQFEKARQLAPEESAILADLLLARVRRGDSGDELVKDLQDLLLRETRPEWRRWARDELAKRGTAVSAPTE